MTATSPSSPGSPASLAPAVARPGAVRLRIVPSRGWPRIDLRELFAYRELFFFLIWRDIKVRYAQTVLGAGWAIIQPIMTMVVFTVVFGGFANIPSDGVPYPVFSLAALVPWTYFSTSLSGASGSLVSSAGLFTKVYFPRLIIPLSRVISGLTSFAISFLILIGMQLAFGIVPSAASLFVIPPLILIMMLTAAGVGSLFSALHVQYRDVGNVVSFLVPIWMYASPIVYPLSLVPEAYRGIYMLNPMVAVIEGFRAVLLGTHPPDWTSIGLAGAVSVALFLGGVLYFRKMEDRFADVV